MVSAITPTTIGALTPNPTATNAEARQRERAGVEPSASPSDSVAIQPGAWLAARDSVRGALADLDLSVAAGREAAAVLGRIGEAARASDDAGLRSLLAQFDALVQKAIEAGASALSGATITAEAEPDAPAFEVAGVDLRLPDDADDRLSLSANAATPEAAAKTAALAQDLLSRLDAALGRLNSASARLQAHAGFLTALQSNVAANVKSDLDAEGARLLALNVRQGLAQSDAAIANTNTDSVLALFRG
ncbi:MAG: hypothetical protein JNJ73_17795 [Hyphomonadaceae bacterium]|nr:hypothetical protein [Hyphomonadaceae bacterium]